MPSFIKFDPCHLTHWLLELFAKKHVFLTFWWFLGCILAKLAFIWLKMHLQHDSLALCSTTFQLGHAQITKFWDSFWIRKWPTVPFKCKLTFSTRNSILEVFENQESRLEFRDTRRIIRGSWTENLRKRFHSRKQNNSNEQNNWCVALFVQTRCWMYANIFFCCAFSTRHSQFAYLHWSWWQQTSLASKCVYNVSCRNEWLFCATTNPERVCCFHLRNLKWPLKCKQTLTAKIYVFPLQSPPNTQKL